jgi:hypothetical protein
VNFRLSSRWAAPHILIVPPERESTSLRLPPQIVLENLVLP